MATILAIANQKGGVGKTTTSVNLAASMASIGQRILLVDLDPQGSATVGCGVNKQTAPATLNDVFLETVTIADAILKTRWAFDVIAANGDLTVSEVRLLEVPNREQRLKNAFTSISHSYDFIIIDCPPSLNILTINALVAADAVLVPTQCEYYALEGLTSLLSSIEKIRATVNPQLQLAGIVRTMYDGRARLTLDVSEQLSEHFGDKLFDTVIPRNVRLAEAPSHGMPVLDYDHRSQGSMAYVALAEEVLRRATNQTERSELEKTAE